MQMMVIEMPEIWEFSCSWIQVRNGKVSTIEWRMYGV